MINAWLYVLLVLLAYRAEAAGRLYIYSITIHGDVDKTEFRKQIRSLIPKANGCVAITTEADATLAVRTHQCWETDTTQCTVFRGARNNQIFRLVLNSVLDESVKQKIFDESCFAARPVSYLNRIYSLILPQAHAGLRPIQHGPCNSKIEMESHPLDQFELRLWNNNTGRHNSLKFEKGPLPTLGDCGGVDESGALANHNGKRFVASRLKDLDRYNHASLALTPGDRELYVGEIAGYREDASAPPGSRTPPPPPSPPVDFFDDATH